ncbi:MAG: aldo/keto reductase [candidate division KSB1 bacterium]|nr:aldo/keto reductase [candidate division KSB1 bacterium]
MISMTRRQFMKTTAGFAALSLPGVGFTTNEPDVMGPVKLGTTGISVSRLAMGTGTHGSEQHSRQTRLGMTGFVDLVQHGYESGVRLFDMADSYGSHPYMREALKEIPRDQVTLLSKVWTRPASWAEFTTAQAAVDRFRQELDVDVIDIVLIHCVIRPDWPELYKPVCDGLSELRERGVIRACGVSCHSFQALTAAVESSWTGVIMGRINNSGTMMGGSPEQVSALLRQARKAGKGVVGMKIYGGGRTTDPQQREESLNFVWNSGAVDATTIGFESTDQVDDTIKRMQRIVPTALGASG